MKGTLSKCFRMNGQSALLSGWIARMHCVSLVVRMVASCTTPPKRTARQCTSLTTSMRKMAVCLLRKNGRLFALIIGCTLVGTGWIRTDCLRPRSARVRSLLTLASHGCMNTVFGPMGMCGLCRTKLQVTLWRVSMPTARKTLSSTTPKTICEKEGETMLRIGMLLVIDADWDTKFCFSSEELGVSKGEYDYVTRGGDLRIREDFEVMAAEAVDDLHKPITVLGRTLKASDIAREMLSDDWEAYVNSCTANLIAMDEVKEVC
nr:MAG TPA: hypothetical protein [Caudoviricetes sp.]